MTPTTKRTKKTTGRSVSLSVMSHGKVCLWIHQDGKLSGYVLTELKSQIGGVGFQLGRATADGCSENYQVLIHGRESSCTCPGHTYHNHCKHVDALLALLSAGRLSPALRQPKPAPTTTDNDFDNP
jgi:hypothetical protein